MKKGKIHLVTAILMLVTLYATAQDHIYSQFFGSPIYLNPSLTGQFEGDFRLNMIYRNQWTGLNADLSYLSASADVHVPKFGGGFGILFNRSAEGSAYLVKNNIAGTYAYSVGEDDFVASFGIQAGVTNRRVNWNSLVFSDQIDMRLGIVPGSQSAAELPSFSQKYYFDAAGGVNFVYKNIMLGGAVYHLNKPDEAFVGSQAKLPMRLTAHLSWRVPLGNTYVYGDESPYFVPTIVYNKQSDFAAMSVGGEFKYRSVKGGIWYRSAGLSQSDAVVISFVFDIFTGKQQTEKVSIGVSHDATLSKINYTNTSGSTEVALGFEKYFRNSGSYNKFNGLRCYDFY